jgi:NAD+--asparagine ADP-ribosyltransferase
MAKDKTRKAAKAESELQDLVDKAVTRGEKLKNTLTKIVGQTTLDAGHPAQTLLKALDKTLGKLRHHGEPEVASDARAKAKKPKGEKAAEVDTPPVAPAKRPSKAKTPGRTPRTSRASKVTPDIAGTAVEAPAVQGD